MEQKKTPKELQAVGKKYLDRYRRYYQKNREKHLQKMREWRQANRDRYNKTMLNYYHRKLPEKVITDAMTELETAPFDCGKIVKLLQAGIDIKNAVKILAELADIASRAKKAQNEEV